MIYILKKQFNIKGIFESNNSHISLIFNNYSIALITDNRLESGLLQLRYQQYFSI